LAAAAVVKLVWHTHATNICRFVHFVYNF